MTSHFITLITYIRPNTINKWNWRVSFIKLLLEWALRPVSPGAAQEWLIHMRMRACNAGNTTIFSYFHCTVHVSVYLIQDSYLYLLSPEFISSYMEDRLARSNNHHALWIQQRPALSHLWGFHKNRDNYLRGGRCELMYCDPPRAVQPNNVAEKVNLI